MVCTFTPLFVGYFSALQVVVLERIIRRESAAFEPYIRPVGPYSTPTYYEQIILRGDVVTEHTALPSWGKQNPFLSSFLFCRLFSFLLSLLLAGLSAGPSGRKAGRPQEPFGPHGLMPG